MLAALATFMWEQLCNYKLKFLHSFCIFVRTIFFTIAYLGGKSIRPGILNKFVSLPVWGLVHCSALYFAKCCFDRIPCTIPVASTVSNFYLADLNNLQSTLFKIIPCKIPPHPALRPRLHQAGWRSCWLFPLHNPHINKGTGSRDFTLLIILYTYTYCICIMRAVNCG